MTRHAQRLAICWVIVSLAARWAAADAYDPPANYYSSATGSDLNLKGQLHKIIDQIDDMDITDIVHTSISYDALRSALQVTDSDPNDPEDRIILVYNRESLDVSGINPGGPIPGWNGSTWNREHTWPQSRGLNGDGQPDGSDLHHMRPSRNQINSDRGNLNFGGAYGSRPGGQMYGVISDGGTKWYPGDADSGMIAREQFYMDVRYDGTQAGTADLVVAAGNPSDSGTSLGDLTRLIEWHFASPPDDFERRRNQIIFDDYQDNRNPFIDRPEFVWPIFKPGVSNNSQIAISGSAIGSDGGSTRNVDLGRVFVGDALPAAQNFTLNKTGNDGTYFEVTTSGATSSLAGRFNAFRTNQTDAKSITVGLNTNTSSAGLKSGTVTINNLDVTTGGGSGHGANDANDLFNVELAVLNHSTPSFGGDSEIPTLTHDFGSIAQGSMLPSFNFDVFNYGILPAFTADLDFDSILSSGDDNVLTTNLGALAGSLSLDGGANQNFTATFDTAAIGEFSATYTLMFSDEDLAGALPTSLTLTLLGEIESALLVGDYNRDQFVDAADFTLWRDTLGASVAEFEGADGNGDMLVDEDDYQVWKDHFGSVAGSGSGGQPSSAPGIPEPASWLLVLVAITGVPLVSRSRKPWRP